ncbi:class I adenylate-forming enzyme family protein [Micromonospora sp. RP3T]|uniref:class I adenylate-forming enzyme family protein n=1 Tax=Micromonospora sp. RP3T TaxID=2135446 RepID=UPI003D75F28F
MPDQPRSGPGALAGQLCRYADQRPTDLAVSYRDVDLNWRELRDEVARRARDAGPVSVVREDERLEFVLDYLAAHAAGVPLVVAGDHEVGWVLNLVEAQSQAVRGLCPGGAEVLFTSGSTARAKAVLLDGAQMARKAAQINEVLGPAPDAIEVLSLPMSHSFGLGRLRCAVSAGRAVRLTDRLPSVDAVFDELRRWPRASFAFVSSVVKLLVARHGEALARWAPGIAQLEIGSEPLEAEVRSQLRRLLPHTRLGMHYGMTELSRVAMVDLHGHHGLDSAGHAMPDTEVRVAMPGSGELRTAGAGDLHVRGAAMVRAYLDDGAVRPVAPDSWLPTGDHGAIGGGMVTIRGRVSHVVNILGKKVVPEETEGVIRRFLGVVDCVCLPYELTAGVFVLAALVVAVPGVPVDRAALHGHLRRSLPAHQVPRRIEFVPDLPRLPNGKVDRRSAGSLVSQRREGR